MEEGTSVSSKKPTQSEEEDIEKFQLIREAQRTFEQRRRTYADIFSEDSDSDNENQDEKKKDSKSSTKDNSDLSSNTDSDSPYGSDSESSSSYDEYYATRQIPKKKNRRHYKGPVKLYFIERIGNWPKYRYKEYKRNYMKNHGIQISYGNVHTREIKRVLKKEKRRRGKGDPNAMTITHMAEDLSKQVPFISLDPEHPIVPMEMDKASLSSFKSLENEPIETKPKSKYQKMKHTVKKYFKRKHKVVAQSNVSDDDNEHLAINSDAASFASANDDCHSSRQSLDKV